MSESLDISADGVERLALKTYTERAYLDYSMYVILDRALPHIGDGLKPVQRRIIYAMSELGLKNAAKHKKSARTVGDVLGKYHPHGDSACYEAMVLMAQPFSYRYTLVDGQGNWGSPDDPKSFAAMRYTEARLAPYADVLLQELGQGTVDWQPNFDGTLDEPQILPSRLPNVLLNGATGIAVGMATDIPPHNLREVTTAAIRLLEDPGCSIDDLCDDVLGPDFPTEAEIITPRNELIRMYVSGKGSVRMRAVYTREGNDVVVTALPYQVSGARVLEQIAQQMNTKKLPMVQDLRDESDHENPTRLVIVPRSNRIDVDALMGHLFATTDLERTYRVNMNMIGLDGRPRVRGLHEILSEWLEFRTTTVRRRMQWRLDKVMERLHRLEGLLIAYLNLDEVIRIIRTEDEPKPRLMERFGLSDIQAETILETKLRHLAKLEEMKIRGEQDELERERKDIENTLGSYKLLKKKIISELKADMERYGDARRSPIVSRAEAKAIDESELMGAEPVTVVLSRKGWVRAAKGHDIDAAALSYKTGDELLATAQGKSNQSAIFIDSTGRSYSVAAHTLPSARSQGEPLTGKLDPPSGAGFEAVVMGGDSDRYVLASDAGYGFILKLEDAHSRNKAGKALLSLPEGARVLPPRRINDASQEHVIVVANDGRLLAFPVADLPELPRGKGNQMINIPSAKAKTREEFMVDMAIMGPKDQLLVYSGKRHLNMKFGDLEHYLGERGRRGNKLPRGFQNVDRIEVVRAGQ